MVGLTLSNYQEGQEKMTQYKKNVEKQRKKLQAEEDDKKKKLQRIITILNSDKQLGIINYNQVK